MNHHSSVESTLNDIKTGEVLLPRDKPIGNLFTGWAVSGIEMARVRSGLLCGTAGTCGCDVKEMAKRSPLKVGVPRRSAGADGPVVAMKGL